MPPDARGACIRALGGGGSARNREYTHQLLHYLCILAIANFSMSADHGSKVDLMFGLPACMAMSVLIPVRFVVYSIEKYHRSTPTAANKLGNFAEALIFAATLVWIISYSAVFPVDPPLLRDTSTQLLCQAAMLGHGFFIHRAGRAPFVSIFLYLATLLHAAVTIPLTEHSQLDELKMRMALMACGTIVHFATSGYACAGALRSPALTSTSPPPSPTTVIVKQAPAAVTQKVSSVSRHADATGGDGGQEEGPPASSRMCLPHIYRRLDAWASRLVRPLFGVKSRELEHAYLECTFRTRYKLLLAVAMVVACARCTSIALNPITREVHLPPLVLICTLLALRIFARLFGDDSTAYRQWWATVRRSISNPLGLVRTSTCAC